MRAACRVRVLRNMDGSEMSPWAGRRDTFLSPPEAAEPLSVDSCLIILIVFLPSFLHSLAFCFLGWKQRWQLGMCRGLWFDPIYFCVLVIKKFCTQRDTKVLFAFLLCPKLHLALKAGRLCLPVGPLPSLSGGRGMCGVPATEGLKSSQESSRSRDAVSSKHREQSSCSHRAPPQLTFPLGPAICWPGCVACLSHWPSVLDWLVNSLMSAQP